jgi:hypothetical protein
VNQDDADHLIKPITQHYPITVDKETKKYIELTIECDYENRKAHISMPVYLKKTFIRFNHIAPDKIQNSPHPHVLPQYGAKVQYAKHDDTSPPFHQKKQNMCKR